MGQLRGVACMRHIVGLKGGAGGTNLVGGRSVHGVVGGGAAETVGIELVRGLVERMAHEVLLVGGLELAGILASDGACGTLVQSADAVRTIAAAVKAGLPRLQDLLQFLPLRRWQSLHASQGGLTSRLYCFPSPSNVCIDAIFCGEAWITSRYAPSPAPCAKRTGLSACRGPRAEPGGSAPKCGTDWLPDSPPEGGLA